MMLNEVNRGIARYKKRKRLGRGIGSGQGKTAGRGHKGQGSRSGSTTFHVFQGGTMPLVRRVPKRGFNNRWGLKIAVVNLGQIDSAYAVGEEVTPESLAEKNLAKGRYDLLKVLGDGELSKKVKISAHRFSKSAVEKIEKAGCQMNVLPGKTPVADKQRAKKEAKRKQRASV
jgi:large subunit ribosomal protein L15